jgi:hypothetical protein
MTISRPRWVYVIAFFIVAISSMNVACNSEKRAAEASLEKFMKSQGVRSLDFGDFITSSATPGKAYLSAVATWNFADNKGNPQKEYLGAIMRKEGNDWSFERFTRYTKNSNDARQLLEGKKTVGPWDRIYGCTCCRSETPLLCVFIEPGGLFSKLPLIPTTFLAETRFPNFEPFGRFAGAIVAGLRNSPVKPFPWIRSGPFALAVRLLVSSPYTEALSSLVKAPRRVLSRLIISVRSLRVVIWFGIGHLDLSLSGL